MDKEARLRMVSPGIDIGAAATDAVVFDGGGRGQAMVSLAYGIRDPRKAALQAFSIGVQVWPGVNFQVSDEPYSRAPVAGLTTCE